MLNIFSRPSLRTVMPAMLFAVGLVSAGPLEATRAAPIADPVDDILTTYTGPQHPGLDVVDHEVTLLDDQVIFFGRMVGPIAPTHALGGLYLFGVDRGRGTPRFRTGNPVIGPNVLWDLIVRINPDGTGQVNNLLAGVITPLDPADISITHNEFTATVPLGLLRPAATVPPEQWTYNLWPRCGIGQTVQVSDLAPDDGNSPVQTIPQVACVTDLAHLSPPNHQMHEVGVVIHASDAFTDQADLVLQVLVTSDEPDDGAGDGNTTGDTNGQDGFTAPVDVTSLFSFNADTGSFEGSVFLRAERAGGNTGRTYAIEVTVVNSYGNLATSSCVVLVPHDSSE